MFFVLFHISKFNRPAVFEKKKKKNRRFYTSKQQPQSADLEMTGRGCLFLCRLFWVFFCLRHKLGSSCTLNASQEVLYTVDRFNLSYYRYWQTNWSVKNRRVGRQVGEEEAPLRLWVCVGSPKRLKRFLCIFIFSPQKEADVLSISQSQTNLSYSMLLRSHELTTLTLRLGWITNWIEGNPLLCWLQI